MLEAVNAGASEGDRLDEDKADPEAIAAIEKMADKLTAKLPALFNVDVRFQIDGGDKARAAVAKHGVKAGDVG